MKKRRRIWVKAGLVILALLILVCYWGNGALDRTVQNAIETGASRALGVAVTVGRVDLGLLDGVVSLTDLKIANPEGYQNETLLTLKRGYVVLDVGSLVQDRVNVTSAVMDTVQVVWEQQGLNNNLQDIIKNMPQRDSSQGSGKPLQVRVLEINQATVKAQLLPIPGQMNALTLRLAPIRLMNLGMDKPMDLESLSGQIMSALVARILEEGSKELPEDIMSPLRKTVQTGTRLLRDASELGKSFQELLRPQEDRDP